MKKSLAAILIAILALQYVGLSQAPFPPLPTPIERATETLQGLMKYYFQAERRGAPPAIPKNCPCFSCDGSNCTLPECSFCNTQPDGCPTKGSNGCYTTAKYECACNYPPGPIPPGANTSAKFYFSCGQMGGLGPFGQSSSIYSCLCESDWIYSCTNCYRWWSAVALESSIDYCMALSKAPTDKGICGEIFKAAESMWIHSPYNADWDAVHHQVYVDDFSWYALAYLKVYDWTGDAVWRNRSAALHDWAWKYGWDHRMSADRNESCGGFWWNMQDFLHFKDSITIVEMLHVSVKLALISNSTTDRARFLASATDIWDWIFAFDNGVGLLAANGIMSTGAVPRKCCSAWSAANETRNITFPSVQCVNSRVPGMSYNHGILMSSAALMYNITADKKYLVTGLSLLDAALENLTDSSGAMLDIQRGSRVAAYGCGEGDPGSDFFSFKGVFIMHVGYFAQLLHDGAALPSDAQEKLLSFLIINSDNVWTKSRVKPPFKGKADVCSLNPNNKKHHPADKYPKFHWWWSNNNGSLQTPPDTRLWFTNSGVDCNYKIPNASNPSAVAASSYLWIGYEKTTDLCRDRCANHTECTKYVFHNSISADCPCFKCDGIACEPPNCTLCGVAGHTSCPHKNSSGCYTSASAECSCTSIHPAPKGNCYLYRLTTHGNRTTMAACTKYGDASEFTMAARRPPPPAADNPASSCRGRCGNTSSIVRNGTALLNITCQCDAACARHMDCCLDYVEECLPLDKQTASCHGHCSFTKKTSGKADNIAIPLPGGGYCYCFGTCLNWFTDNNSMGSCCADYYSACAEGAYNSVCLDPRTQTQALQAFVSHHKLQNMTASP